MSLSYNPGPKPFDPETIRGIGINNADLLKVGEEITLKIDDADSIVLHVDGIDDGRISVHVVAPDTDAA